MRVRAVGWTCRDADAAGGQAIARLLHDGVEGRLCQFLKENPQEGNHLLYKQHCTQLLGQVLLEEGWTEAYEQWCKMPLSKEVAHRVLEYAFQRHFLKAADLLVNGQPGRIFDPQVLWELNLENGVDTDLIPVARKAVALLDEHGLDPWMDLSEVSHCRSLIYHTLVKHQPLVAMALLEHAAETEKMPRSEHTSLLWDALFKLPRIQWREDSRAGWISQLTYMAGCAYYMKQLGMEPPAPSRLHLFQREIEHFSSPISLTKPEISASLWGGAAAFMCSLCEAFPGTYINENTQAWFKKNKDYLPPANWAYWEKMALENGTQAAVSSVARRIRL